MWYPLYSPRWIIKLFFYEITLTFHFAFDCLFVFFFALVLCLRFHASFVLCHQWRYGPWQVDTKERIVNWKDIMQRSVHFGATQCTKKIVSDRRGDGNFSNVDLWSFRHHVYSPPANSRPQFYQTSSTFVVQERRALNGELTGDAVNQIFLEPRNHSTNNLTICCLSLHKRNRKP